MTTNRRGFAPCWVRAFYAGRTVSIRKGFCCCEGTIVCAREEPEEDSWLERVHQPHTFFWPGCCCHALQARLLLRRLQGTSFKRAACLLTWAMVLAPLPCSACRSSTRQAWTQPSTCARCLSVRPGDVGRGAHRKGASRQGAAGGMHVGRVQAGRVLAGRVQAGILRASHAACRVPAPEAQALLCLPNLLPVCACCLAFFAPSRISPLNPSHSTALLHCCHSPPRLHSHPAALLLPPPRPPHNLPATPPSLHDHLQAWSSLCTSASGASWPCCQPTSR